MDAEAFLAMLRERNIRADAAIFDPPYSPRQISELYRRVGRQCSSSETQNAALYRRVRDGVDGLLDDGAIVLSFGWNSAGMGRGRGYELIDLRVFHHGGAHNDTIGVAECKRLKAAVDSKDYT